MSSVCPNENGVDLSLSLVATFKVLKLVDRRVQQLSETPVGLANII